MEGYLKKAKIMARCGICGWKLYAPYDWDGESIVYCKNPKCEVGKGEDNG